MNEEFSRVTGKTGEYEVIGKLMQEGFIVYTPVLDIDGVDCVIKNDKGRLIELQIKTRTQGEEGYDKDFIVKRQLNPNLSFFICCYLKDNNNNRVCYIPSYVFQKLSTTNEKGWSVLTMDLQTRKELLKYEGKDGIRALQSEEPNYEK
jgi:hypothetical protein